MIPPSVLLENSLNIFYLKISEDGEIQYANELFNSYASHIQPTTLSHIIYDSEDMELAKKAMSKAVRSSPFPSSFQCRLTQKNGAKRWCTWEVAYGNNQYHLFGIQLFDVVSITAHEYEEQQRLLEKVVWIQSHKVRKPLANILGLTYLLDKQVDGEEKDIINMLKQSAQELDDVVKEITEMCDKLRP
jgi:nitrogen-specific signal transduction histidine kinase